jgi:dTDP-4-dehydrorhamnose reductase
MQTVLITGTNGFAGSHLQKLLRDKYAVIATGRNETAEDNVHFLKMNITDQAEVHRVFDAVKPDIVIHLAAISKPDECELNREKAFKINTTSVKYLLEASSKFKSHFIFLSTDFVFDGQKGMYAEDDILSPVNYYGETKLISEGLVKQYAFDACIIRTSLVYGVATNKDNILTMTAKSLRKGEPLEIVNDQLRTPTFVGDLCKGILSVIQHRARGIYHISGKDVMTPYEMAVATAKHLNLDEKLITPVTQSSFTQPARRPLKTGFDISKARRELGYEPVSFQEGLERTFSDKPLVETV